MKKKLIYLASLFTLSVAILTLAPSCSKDEDPAPKGPTYSYSTSLGNTNFVLTSNRSAAFASGSLGSFYSVSGKTTGSSSSLGANGDFKLLDKNTSATGSPNPYLSTEGTKATKFSTTSLDFATARAGQVDSAAAPGSSDIYLTSGSTILFQLSDGKKGLIKVESLSDAVVTAGGSTKNATLSIKVSQKD